MRHLSTTILLFIATLAAKADYVVNIPQTLTQPDGEVIHCFASGDEFFNRLHDAEGYTIIQADDGYYYYATERGGELVPSSHRVGQGLPAQKGLRPNLKISRADYLKLREAKFRPSEPQKKTQPERKNTGEISAITIYIRFSDDAEFSRNDVVQQQNNFNGSTNSVKDYFQKITYNQLTINTIHRPANEGSEMSSYVSTNKRDYYRPYNATTNTSGYRNDTERSTREWALLRDAVNWVRINHPIPDNLNIDNDKDGYADVVAFIIKGNSDGWNDLLWAHKWELPASYGGTNYQAVIRGNIRVKEFTFQPEQQTSVRTLCHETFHVFGAPDLYHYEVAEDLIPAGAWDLMESGYGHPLTHLKAKYGGWISSNFPEITTAGQYTLYPQGKHSTGNAFKVAESGRSEHFVLEYRQRSDDAYELNLPGSGLIVSRIRPSVFGNADYDGITNFDEVYVLRPGGTPTGNGALNNAHLSDLVGRTALSQNHANQPFYSNGTFANFTIYDVVDYGDSLRFRYLPTSVADPSEFLGKWRGDSIHLVWTAAGNVVLIGDTMPLSTYLTPGSTYPQGTQLPQGATVLYAGDAAAFAHEVIAEKTYYYRLFASSGTSYSVGVDLRVSTVLDTISTTTTITNLLPTDTDASLGFWYFGSESNPVFGHNTYGFYRFVERFKNEDVRRVSGMMLPVAKSVARSSEPYLYLSVWDVGADGFPNRELSVETIPYSSITTLGGNSRNWNALYFKNPPVVSSDFFIGITIRYLTPRDTFVMYTTDDVATRPINSYLIYNDAYTSVSTLISRNIGYAYRPIMISGGYYLTTLPQWLNPATSGATGMTVDIHTTYPDYEVVSNEDWIHFSVDKFFDRLTVDVDPTDVDRVGEILLIANGDTAYCFVRQGASVPIQRSEELAVGVFPNPSKDGIFYLESDGGEMLLEVYDLLGRRIWSRRSTSSGERIDLSGHKAGVYVLRITKGGQSTALRLVIEG